jgi:CubicO group peptidase (beta-lactamase class C family)
MKLRTVIVAASLLAPAAGVNSAARFDAVRSRMSEFVDKGEISGVVTLIATPKSVIHLSAVGKSDLATGRKMRTNDIFWIASMSKPITAVCVGILVDEGKLRFEDAVEDFLPEFVGKAITLRQVLTHTSGLGELNTRDPHLSLSETSKAIARLPLVFQPGSQWRYSTAGFDVMGRVVEVASGMPFAEFLQKRVFDPLGMKDTGFWVSAAKKDRWTHSYQWVAEESKLRETTIPYMYGTDVTDRGRPPLGGAGLFSTAEDAARFYQMMLNGGELRGRRILTSKTVGEMTRKQTANLRARPGMPWGLGFCVVEQPQAMDANRVLSPNSFGHGGAYSTQSWADPSRNLIWIVMFQRTGKGNPDNSDVRIAFQDAAVKDL